MKLENLLVNPSTRVLADRAHPDRDGHRQKVLDVHGLLCGL
jgi:hypothetical protein